MTGALHLVSVVMWLIRIVPALAIALAFDPTALHASTGTIKEEYQRAQACDYINAEFISDVGVFADEKVRYCISDDGKELIYVMAMGTSWVVPFDRQYRADGFVNYHKSKSTKSCQKTHLKSTFEKTVFRCASMI